MAIRKRRIRMKVRATPDAGDGTFSAVVSTYSLEYDIGWGWTEQILPGCFTESIAAHPTIPVYHQHDWDSAPIGSCQPSEQGSGLEVSGQLYVGAEFADPFVKRIYQAMLDEALEEWSIGFWPEEISWSEDSPTCDSIVKGDLAEASICVRGANPETGTLELNRRQLAYVEGDEVARQREVSRLRTRYAGLPELDIRDASDPSRRDSGHTHEHKHGDTVHSHAHTHGAGNYEHGAEDPEITHSHSHPEAEAELARTRAAQLMSTAWGREQLAAERAKRGAA